MHYEILKKTLEKMENAYEHLQNSSQNTVNLTDPECVWRPNKGIVNNLIIN